MEELKPCPFCGGEAELQNDIGIEGRICYRAVCADIECQGHYCNQWSCTPEKAISAWNKRYKRTCKYDIDQMPEGGTVYTTCSECGWQCDLDYQPKPRGFRFCPNCGAKVLNDD